MQTNFCSCFFATVVQKVTFYIYLLQISPLTIVLTSFFHIFANAYRSQKPDMGYVGGCKFYWEAFTNALSWLFEIWKISFTVKIVAAVDALWCVYAYRLHYGC